MQIQREHPGANHSVSSLTNKFSTLFKCVSLKIIYILEIICLKLESILKICHQDTDTVWENRNNLCEIKFSYYYGLKLSQSENMRERQRLRQCHRFFVVSEKKKRETKNRSWDSAVHDLAASWVSEKSVRKNFLQTLGNVLEVWI